MLFRHIVSSFEKITAKQLLDDNVDRDRNYNHLDKEGVQFTLDPKHFYDLLNACEQWSFWPNLYEQFLVF